MKFYYSSNELPCTFLSYKFYRVTNHKPHSRNMTHKVITSSKLRCRTKIFRNVVASHTTACHLPEEGNQSTHPCRENLKSQKRDNSNTKSGQTRFLFRMSDLQSLLFQGIFPVCFFTTQNVSFNTFPLFHVH